MSELTDKIERIILNNSFLGGSFIEKNAKKTAAEIAAMIEERKPDTITVPEAVERLVEFFSGGVVEVHRGYAIWFINIRLSGGFPAPSYYEAINNGNNFPAAVKVGLEDLFVTILTESEK